MNNREFISLMEKDVTYHNIEDLFTSEKYYRAMKGLSKKEKEVLFLTAIEDKSLGEVAEVMNTTKNNIWQIREKAKKKFFKNIPNED